ncbi:MAG: ABC transporter permease [Nitrososphaerales archaeon]|nr:ABC transporter permease [Nitrososphaerales archaeon]
MRVTAVFKAVTRNWLRSRSGLFFSFLFPIIFLLLFGSIFGTASKPIPLTVQNNDASNGGKSLSQTFIATLNSTKAIIVSEQPQSVNVTAYIQNQAGTFGGNPRLLVIPQGFAANITRGLPSRLTYIFSPADPLGAQAGGVVSSVANAFSLNATGTHLLIGLSYTPSSVRPLTFIDYYMPGLIAAFMMTNGVIGLTNVATEFRRTGLTKRLSATPLTKLEWMVGNVLSQTLLALLLAAVMIILAEAAYHTTVTIDVYSIVTLVVGAVLFSGIGMTLAGFVRDPEAASGLGNAIAFPMMFLSGTFWTLDVMPSYLQAVAKVLPLTYFSNGLRDSMILNNPSAVLVNVGVSTAFAVAFIAIGAWATRWKEA